MYKLNKHVRNAIEVTLDSFIDYLIDIRSRFELETDIEMIRSLGHYGLRIIKDHLKSDINGTQECLNDSIKHLNEMNKLNKKLNVTKIIVYNDEIDMFKERLNDQKNALMMINNTLIHEPLKNMGFEDSTSANDICINYTHKTNITKEIKIFCPNDSKQNYDNELFNTYKCDIDDNDQFVNYTIFETKSLTEMLSFLKSNLTIIKYWDWNIQD